MRTELGKSTAPNASTSIGFCAPRRLAAPWHAGADHENEPEPLCVATFAESGVEGSSFNASVRSVELMWGARPSRGDGKKTAHLRPSRDNAFHQNSPWIRLRRCVGCARSGLRERFRSFSSWMRAFAL
jgi:hypothetical protein